MYVNHQEQTDLFIVGTRVNQISRTLLITAEDTTERAHSPQDVKRNMEILHMLSDELNRIEKELEAMDEYKVKHGDKLAEVL